MSTEKRVFNKLFKAKTNLAKVNLSLIDDLADKAFKGQNDLTNNYSSDWDGDTLNFFRR